MGTIALILAVVALVIAAIGMVAVPGPTGPAGAKGDTGAEGLEGDTGPRGYTGPQGPAGLQGAQGLAGADGANGINCWDLNGNGMGDLPAEDLNSDGGVDVNDCTGSQGPAGTGTVVAFSATGDNRAMVGCTNFDSVAIIVPQAGIIVLTSLVKLDIEHFLGTEDRWAITFGTDAMDCFNPPEEWVGEIPGQHPTETQIELSGYVQAVSTVSAAGTYTYYLNGVMQAGQSAQDRHDYSNTVAVFYSS